MTQAFLCTFLVLYDFYCSRKNRFAIEDVRNDPWRTILDDFLDWIAAARLPLLTSVILFNYGTYYAIANTPRSTFFCSSLINSRKSIVFFQLVGLALDLAIIIILWRVLAWAKTTKARLRTLSLILLLSSLSIGLLWLSARAFSTGFSSRPPHPTVKGINSLYIFDIFIDSFSLSSLIISCSLLTCEATPLTPVSVITFFSGLLAALYNLSKLGTWQQESLLRVLVPICLICFGFSLFIYASNMRFVVYIHRVIVVILLFSIMISATIFAFVKETTLDRHPLNKFIYDSRIQADRWLRYASVSNSLRVAVLEYRERHHRREPPLNFDKWYDFAKTRNSAIMDHFEQIESDILPFWGIKPENIRQRVELAKGYPGIAVIDIQGGHVSHTGTQDEHKKALDTLVKMIESFVMYLPDMALPINLDARPRVLTPWEDNNHLLGIATSSKLNLLSRDTWDPRNQSLLSSREFTQMESMTCPSGSKGRSSLHWNVRDFCSPCAGSYSDGQFMLKWELSKDMCSQPDLARLHGFHIIPPALDPSQELVPIFSRYKTSSFSDILLPLPSPMEDEPDSVRDFYARTDRLFWRGRLSARELGQPVFWGSHKYRLVHLLNNASSSDQTTMMLPTPSNKARYAYRKIRVADINNLLPTDVGIVEYPPCDTTICALAMEELGRKADDLPLNYRYVLLLDEYDGPPPTMMRTLKSGSVPFVSTIFKEWYSERLMPWVHFVPVDIRFHSLHSTLAYFVGLKGRGKLNGQDVELEQQSEDASWIANQGKVWVEKAIRKEDMEIYLFRLLLEWGRVIDDERDSRAFQFEA
jgi:hypothetical protein